MKYLLSTLLSLILFSNLYALTLTTQSEIDDFTSTTLTENLYIKGDDITNLDGLSSLTYLDGTLVIGYSNGAYTGCPNLLSLTGLDNLTYVSGAVVIRDCSQITSIELNSLDSIGVYLSVYFNDNLVDFQGLENLISIGGYLAIRSLPALESLDGLNNLISVGNDLIIGAEDYPNNSLINVTGLESLASIGGYVSIAYNQNLESLGGLSNLSFIGEYLDIIHNDSLSDLNLTILPFVSDLTVEFNNSLIDFQGLENLDSISGTFEVRHNQNLTNFIGFSATNFNWLIIRWVKCT